MLNHFLDVLDVLVKKLATLKLPAFSSENLKRIYDQIALLNNQAFQLYELDKQTAEQKEQLKQLSNSEANKHQTLELSKTLLQAAFVKKAQAWRRKQSVEFAKENVWQRFEINAPKRLLEIQELYASWKLYGEYATFSAPDLIGVYWRNIGVIHHWLITAQQELQLKKVKLSQELAEQCQSNLNVLLAELEQVKQAMRASLLARLEIGISRGDLGFDDVVANTTQILMQLGAMPSTTLPNGLHRHMIPSTLHYIRQIISIDGNETEKAKLSAILNVRSGQGVHNRTSLVERSNAAGVLFLIPQNVQTIFPKQPPFYTKLPKILQFYFMIERRFMNFFKRKIVSFYC